MIYSETLVIHLKDVFQKMSPIINPGAAGGSFPASSLTSLHLSLKVSFLLHSNNPAEGLTPL